MMVKKRFPPKSPMPKPSFILLLTLVMMCSSVSES